MIWVVYALIILFYLIFSKEKPEAGKDKYLKCITFILILMTGLRHLGMGNDTYAYYLEFIDSKNLSFSQLFDNFSSTLFETSSDQNKDPGYSIFNKLCYIIFGGSYVLYQMFVATLLLVPFAKIIRENVPDLKGYMISYGLYVSLFYSYLPNSATRQSVALGLFLCALLIWLKKKKYIVPIILFLVAATIHKSVLINILPISLLVIRKNKSLPTITAFGFILIFVLGSAVMAFLGDLSMSENYTGYSESSYYSRAGRPYGFIIEMVVFYIIAYTSKPKIDKQINVKNYIFINFYLGIIFCPVILVDPSLQRLTAYFAIWSAIYLPNVVNNYDFRNRKIVFVILMIMTFGRPILTGDQDYAFFWQDHQLHQRYGNGADNINYEGY